MKTARVRSTRLCRVCGARFSTQRLLGLHTRHVHDIALKYSTQPNIEDRKRDSMNPKTKNGPFYFDVVDELADLYVKRYDSTSSKSREELKMKYDDSYQILREIDECTYGSAPDSPEIEGLIQGYKNRLKLDQVVFAISSCWSENLHHDVNQVLEGLGLAPESLILQTLCSADDNLVQRLVRFVREGVCVEQLHGEQAQSFVDLAYEVLRPRDPSGPRPGNSPRRVFKKAFNLEESQKEGLHRITSRLAEKTRKIPLGLVVESVTLSDTFPCFSGSYGDVYVGNMDGQKVAIKRMKIYQQQKPEDRQKLDQNLCREVLMWSLLDHPSVLPFYGINNHLFGQVDVPGLISPFLDNGTLMVYLEKQEVTDVLIWRLLTEIVTGLWYLHAHNIVHGDLRPPNIFIDDDGHIKLSDFRLANFADSSLQSTSNPEAGAPSPERYLEDYRPSKEADVFAVGTVCWEVCTGKFPFCPKSGANLQKRQLPDNASSKDIPPRVWWVVALCWKWEPGDRPRADTLLGLIEDSLAPSVAFIDSSWFPRQAVLLCRGDTGKSLHLFFFDTE